MSAGKILHTGNFVHTQTLKNWREHIQRISNGDSRGSDNVRPVGSPVSIVCYRQW